MVMHPPSFFMARVAVNVVRRLQVNVRELVCCDEPDKFGSVRAIPDFKVCSFLALLCTYRRLAPIRAVSAIEFV